LLTLLIAVPLIGLACARYIAWRQELRGEVKLSGELAVNAPRGVGSIQPPPPTTTSWSPPIWLPEWAAKLGTFGHDFDRITIVQISGDTVTDETLRKLAVFGQLRSLRLFNTRVSAAGWKHLGRLPQLGMLEVEVSELSDADLECPSGKRGISRTPRVGAGQSS
jgi:hypothetical protein